MRKHCFTAVLLLIILGSAQLLTAQEKQFETTEPSAFALFAAGIGFMEISSLIEGPILLTSQYESILQYREYLESSTGDYDLYDADWNNRLSALTLAQWGAGSAFVSSLLLFPPEQVTVSLFGKITAIAGWPRP